MTRSTESFEDVIASLTGALASTGQALTCAAAAVQMMVAAEKEVAKEATAAPPQAPAPAVAAVMPLEPPRWVRLCPKRCHVSKHRGSNDDVGKTVCQLRRDDTGEWLWTSRPYLDPKLSVRDAKATATRFGWKIVASMPLGNEAPTDCLPDDAPTAARAPDAVPKSYVDEAKPAGDDAFQRGFDAGSSTRLSLVRFLSETMTNTMQGKLRPSQALGEIARMAEKEMGLPTYTMWPDLEVADLPKSIDQQLKAMMQVLILTKAGKIEVTTSFHLLAERLEKVLCLPEGAIWAKGEVIKKPEEVEKSHD